jgi:two-component system sensor histidine kinase KdpD
VARVRACTADATVRSDRRTVDRLQSLTDDLGARWHELEDDDPARAIAKFAREHQITQIVIGSSKRSRWQQLTGGGSNVSRIIREAGAFGIDVHVIARTDAESGGALAVSSGGLGRNAEEG